MRQIFVVLVVVLVVVSAVVVAAGALELARPTTSPCTPAGGAVPPGGSVCPIPPPPSPTVLVASGTVYTVPAGQYDYFQFHPTPASSATLEGSFVTDHQAAVYVMTPSAFTNFSASRGWNFDCSEVNQSCFSTGIVAFGSLGRVNISFLPIYPTYSPNGTSTAAWFFVMQNANGSVASTVWWTTNVVASYSDAYE